MYHPKQLLLGSKPRASVLCFRDLWVCLPISSTWRKCWNTFCISINSMSSLNAKLFFFFLNISLETWIWGDILSWVSRPGFFILNMRSWNTDQIQRAIRLYGICLTTDGLKARTFLLSYLAWSLVFSFFFHSEYENAMGLAVCKYVESGKS